MNTLILGGTVFLGRHLVDAALERGHTVTLFNRGQHNPDLYPHLEKLRGDRSTDLSALEHRDWDAVIDTSGYVPRVVRAAAERLADHTGHYTFISSISVYADTSRPITEDDPAGTLEDESTETINGETYGPLKALCEQAAERAMPGRVLNVRPGLIVGPHDPSDRFTYWPARIDRGGETLAPGDPDRPVQLIDARDLAEWIVHAVERRTTGVFNATGPDHELSMRDTLDACRRAAESDAQLTWVPDEFLLQHNAGPWMELPLWIPDTPDTAGFNRVSSDRAVAAGLRYRPLETTVRDTLEWARARPADHQWRAGMTAERERAILDAWHARTT